MRIEYDVLAPLISTVRESDVACVRHLLEEGNHGFAKFIFISERRDESLKFSFCSHRNLVGNYRTTLAIAAYLQGYYFFERNTDKDTDMAAKYFERAAQIDPSYALAWAWLSRARNWQANEGLVPREEGRRLSREAVERALALNPNLAAAHSQMGRIMLHVDFDWAGADASIRRAMALEPGNPEYLDGAAYSAAMFSRSDAYAAQGRKKESDAALKELIAKHYATSLVAQVYAFRNQRDEAFEWLDRAYVQQEGNVAYTNLLPMLKNLRSDPRYAAFLKKHNLPN